MHEILKKYLIEAKRSLLKESLMQKAQIIKKVKQLITAGVDKNKIENILSFYKYSIDNKNAEIENIASFNEMMVKLDNLAESEGVILPQE